MKSSLVFVSCICIGRNFSQSVRMNTASVIATANTTPIQKFNGPPACKTVKYEVNHLSQ